MIFLKGETQTKCRQKQKCINTKIAILTNHPHKSRWHKAELFRSCVKQKRQNHRKAHQSESIFLTYSNDPFVKNSAAFRLLSIFSPIRIF